MVFKQNHFSLPCINSPTRGCLPQNLTKAMLSYTLTSAPFTKPPQHTSHPEFNMNTIASIKTTSHCPLLHQLSSIHVKKAWGDDISARGGSSWSF